MFSLLPTAIVSGELRLDGTGEGTGVIRGGVALFEDTNYPSLLHCHHSCCSESLCGITLGMKEYNAQLRSVHDAQHGVTRTKHRYAKHKHARRTNTVIERGKKN